METLKTRSAAMDRPKTNPVIVGITAGLLFFAGVKGKIESVEAKLLLPSDQQESQRAPEQSLDSQLAIFQKELTEAKTAYENAPNRENSVAYIEALKKNLIFLESNHDAIKSEMEAEGIDPKAIDQFLTQTSETLILEIINTENHLSAIVMEKTIKKVLKVIQRYKALQ